MGDIFATAGPLMQGEYTHADAQLSAGGAADLEGGYIQVGYFLTREHRGYKRSSNAFARTKVIEPFFRVRTAEGICRGKGAWEIAYRWAKADLDDVSGHEYVTPSGAAGGQVDALGMRFQVDF